MSATASAPNHADHFEHRSLWYTLKTLDPVSASAIGILHLACFAAPFTFTWSGLAWAVALWWACGGLGICLCYHRLLTHRSFKTYRPVEYLLTTLGTMCFEGGPVKWVGTHRIHHRHSDDHNDPHTPKHGFNWSHIFWCVTKEQPGFHARDAAKDLQRDPVTKWLDQYHYVPQFVLIATIAGLGFAFGGVPLMVSWLVWGIAVRVVFTYHATWFVNSAAHTWGYRNHNTKDDSRNNWWVALVSFGEGWHNNHHHDHRAAAHGRRWFEVDLTYLTILAMARAGLAWDVVAPKPAKALSDDGDGSLPPPMDELPPVRIPRRRRETTRV